MNIKLSGRFIERMNQQCPYARILGHRNRSQDSILEQRGSKFSALAGQINSQPPQHHDRDGVRHIAPYSPRCIGMRHCTNSQRIVAHHATKLSSQHEGSARSGYLVGQGAALEPFIESRFTAIKPAAVVDLRQRLGWLHRAAFYRA